jgi:iron complex outermembrane receptor protein
MQVKKIVLCAATLFSFSIAVVSGSEVELEKIVVTPYRYAEEFTKIPAGITVITQEDIQDAGAKSVPDILRRVPGLAVRDFYGNGAKASVDARGFGELGAMNVLVLIDGRRINEIDLSGVSWNQIPLEQVEKIEVLHGGAGSVLYGENATGGVINIITKKGEGKPHLVFEAQAGSYAMNKQILSLNGSQGAFSYWAIGSHDNSNGYRKNSYYKAEDFASKFTYDLDRDFSLRFSNSFHASSYGMPGAIRESQFAELKRTDTFFPGDHAHDKDYYFGLSADKEFAGLANFEMGASFRRREVYSHLGNWNPVYKSKIDTLGITPKLVINKNFFSLANKLITGLDYYRADYSSDNYNGPQILQNASDINKTSLGYYLQDELSLFKNLTLVSGFRYEYAKYEFDYCDLAGWVPGVDQDLKPDNTAYSAGLNYKYQSGSSLFFNLNRSFRFPAPDEYFSAFANPPINTSLKPQAALSYEAGIKHRILRRIECGLTIFRMHVRNELFYNPLTFANENYDKTRHDGIEFSADAELFKKISLFGSYTFTKSIFIDGIYDKKNVPMVPRHKGSLGAKFSLSDSLSLNIQANYTGERYFINDPANNFSRANGYFTADMNSCYTYKDFSATFGINNIFDKEYSEYVVYSTMSAEKGYYPSPKRNFYLKLKYIF